jgi:TPR repeat protein
MKLAIVDSFRGFFSELKLLTENLIHESLYSLYIEALSEASKDSPKGFFLLGQIYEQGTSFVSSNLALAYAMYCLSAEKELSEARQEALRLKSRLNARDWARVNKTLGSFNSHFRI